MEYARLVAEEDTKKVWMPSCLVPCDSIGFFGYNPSSDDCALSILEKRDMSVAFGLKLKP